MVHGIQADSDVGGYARLPAVLVERVRVLSRVYEELDELIGEWRERMGGISDEVMIGVAFFYKELCRDLAGRIDELFRDASGTAIDLGSLRNAREHMSIIDALDPVRIVEAEKNIRAGRFVTLEQMRHELRNKAR